MKPSAHLTTAGDRAAARRCAREEGHELSRYRQRAGLCRRGGGQARRDGAGRRFLRGDGRAGPAPSLRRGFSRRRRRGAALAATVLFDAAAMNFGILHLGQPEKALLEAHRFCAAAAALLSRSGPNRKKPSASALSCAPSSSHGEPRVELPEGPPFFRYSDPDECSRGLDCRRLRVADRDKDFSSCGVCRPAMVCSMR